MTTNADIVIFNLRIDSTERREVFIPTNISEVSYYSVISTDKSGSRGEIGRDESPNFKIRIPIDAVVEDQRTYVPEELYKTLSDEEAREHWTIQKGCYILLGTLYKADEWKWSEFNLRSGAILKEQITEMSALQEYRGNFIIVSEYADNTIRGSDKVKHWRIGGS